MPSIIAVADTIAEDSVLESAVATSYPAIFDALPSSDLANLDCSAVINKKELMEYATRNIKAANADIVADIRNSIEKIYGTTYTET
ncbi:MAG: hypothetical protein DRZ80_02325 [Thermoprotei archaeon]|nr:MAG: hypothetical protein DRZ80_02325 [Thermoprotei archaeon]